MERQSIEANVRPAIISKDVRGVCSIERGKTRSQISSGPRFEIETGALQHICRACRREVADLAVCRQHNQAWIVHADQRRGDIIECGIGWGVGVGGALRAAIVQGRFVAVVTVRNDQVTLRVHFRADSGEGRLVSDDPHALPHAAFEQLLHVEIRLPAADGLTQQGIHAVFGVGVEQEDLLGMGLERIDQTEAVFLRSGVGALVG